jgi:hypothetical protein
MEDSPAVLNARALRRHQLAAYQHAKLTPPDLSAAALTARDVASSQALAPGGSIEQAIAEGLRTQGRDPEAAKSEGEKPHSRSTSTPHRWWTLAKRSPCAIRITQ